MPTAGNTSSPSRNGSTGSAARATRKADTKYLSGPPTKYSSVTFKRTSRNLRSCRIAAPPASPASTALRHAFFRLPQGQPRASVPLFAVYRRVDTRARINRVHISQEELLVEVEGSALDGITVEMAGDAPGFAETLKASAPIHTVTFQLTDGLPAGAWVVVRAGSEWLDRRFLAWTWVTGQEAGVTVEVPAKTKIDAFIAARESDIVEFKQEIPENEAARAKVMKTVCAFANGSGGSLLFGITDDYELKGLPEAKASKHTDTLSNLIDAWVEPTPSYSFNILPIEGTLLVVIELIVSAGATLYALAKRNEPHRIYVRHHSRSVRARVREIERIVSQRAASSLPWH